MRFESNVWIRLSALIAMDGRQLIMNLMKTKVNKQQKELLIGLKWPEKNKNKNVSIDLRLYFFFYFKAFVDHVIECEHFFFISFSNLRCKQKNKFCCY